MKVNQLALYFITACYFIPGLANASVISRVQDNEDTNAYLPSTAYSTTQKPNVALKRNGGQATQSSTAHGGAASRAIDGYLTGWWKHGSVTHTKRENNPHWEVQLDTRYFISQINVLNRQDCCKDRIRNFVLTIYDNGIVSYTSTISNPGKSKHVHKSYSFIFNVSKPIKGDKIRIHLPGANRILSLAEVQVLSGGKVPKASTKSPTKAPTKSPTKAPTKTPMYGCTPATCGWKQLGANVEGDIVAKHHHFTGFSADGSRLAFGERWFDKERGLVRVFDFNGSNWVPVGSPLHGEEAKEGFFRCYLSGDGSALVVGSPWFRRNTGKLTVYRFENGDWRKIGQDLVGEKKGDYSSMGSITHDGSRVVTSSYSYDDERGHVKVYDYDADSDQWQQIGNTIQGSAKGERFGGEVFLSGDGSRFIAGAQYANNKAGYAAIYELQNGTWEPIKTMLGDTDEPGECGARNAASADGSRFAYSCVESGKVFVYDVDMGAFVGDVIESEGSGKGIGLSSDGSRIVIASPMSEAKRGKVELFEYDHLDSKSWNPMAEPIVGEMALDCDGFSVKLSEDGTKVLTDGRGHGNKSGHVRAFELVELNESISVGAVHVEEEE